MTWLRAFEAAARHSSFSGAAAELNLTPAAVSQQIRLLEQHLGIQLFHRLPRGVALTDMGQAYALPIRKSFTEMQDATEGLFTVRRKRKVRIRASISYATLILAPRLKAFRDLYPDIELSLSTAVWSDRMDNETIDLDIRYGTGHWDEPHIWKLGEETAMVVCHPDHARAFGDDPRIEDMLAAGIVPVLGSEVEWVRLSDLFGLDLPAPPVWLKADSSLIALQTVTAGFGAALIHESFAKPYMERGVLTSPFDYRLPVQQAYYLVARDGLGNRDEIDAFRTWLMTPDAPNEPALSQ
ncbi:LysR substrate-binding domain-containing protein [Rhodalgimonas zhirmunskyi]|uniref:LysR substrate-binding domain-containing protein n=1 Tax=Rhodalgimonas zhirmunskyi TaxID=2964767 RepID=A0AAJ1UEC6_9RHOB|nr:LysR substrate-binding domain-containing protein [Rhodoalgimonas zhirmunskyi]MDQ2094467.1 LysR substrate-binding domain-containing protein [Rhodoalgimonas zhirmunskyi]